MTAVVHHVSITCHNIEASKQFYELFGFITEKKCKDDQVTICLMDKKGSSKIEIFHFCETPRITLSRSDSLPDIRNIGFTHIALKVDSLDD